MIKDCKLPCLFLSLFICACQAHSGNEGLVSGGHADLRAVTDWGVLPALSGQWNFRWAGPDKAPQQMRVPGPWNQGFAGQSPLPAYGRAVYSLQVSLPESVSNCSLLVHEVGSAYRVSVNGQVLGGLGKLGLPAENGRWRFGYQSYEFNAAGSVLIEMEVENTVYKDGGILSDILIGPSVLVHQHVVRKSRYDFFLAGSLLFMALYHLVLYILRRKERALFYFSVTCFLVFLRGLLVGGYYLSMGLPGIPFDLFYKLDMLTITLTMMMFIIYLHSMYPADVSPGTRLVTTVPGLVMSLAVVVLPSWIVSLGLNPVLLVSGVLSYYCLFFLVKVFIRRREGSALIMLGMSVQLVMVMLDIVSSQYLVRNHNLMPLGFFVFMLSQAVVLAYRYTRAYYQSELLTGHLDGLVKERTVELQNEKQKLQQQNQAMVEELRLAQKIQREFIPRKAPFPELAFYYKPMDEVGGDYFDFIELPRGLVGIFISDVSGHGVPAALVTSMIKSFMMQFARTMRSPAELLTLLNDFLYNLTTGQFVTAFYGIYDPHTRRITFANAGHNYPYQIDQDKVHYLYTAKRGIPLAVMEHEALQLTGKFYRDEKLELEAGTRLVFFTDGLTEAVNTQRRQNQPEGDLKDFESEGLLELLNETRSLPSDRAVEVIRDSLVAYRGTATFDDDVCIICLDVK